LFAKNQVTPTRKPLGRVICGESIVDQVIHRVLFGGFGVSEASVYPFGPNVKGLGFDELHATQLFQVYEAIRAKHGNAVSSDVSGWEKNFSADCCDAAVHVLEGTCSNADPMLHHFLLWWKWSLLTNLFIDGLGILFYIWKELGMKSGNYLTNSANGIARGTVGRYAGSTVVKTNGDDAFEWFPGTVDQLVAEYAAMNVHVRDVTPLTNRLLFSSHAFERVDGRVVCWLETWPRMFCGLLVNSRSSLDFESAVTAACDELAAHPDWTILNRFIRWVDAYRYAKKHGGELGLAPNA
jgi:hypothetical protein